MKQTPMIYGIGSSPAHPPAVATATPFRAEAQTEDGLMMLNISFEGAKDLKRELDLYLEKYSKGR
jgi:hypothetical protein